MDFDNLLETITPTASTSLIISTTGALGLPASTTANRPATSTNGMIRYNTDLNALEAYTNSAWTALASSTPSAVRVATTANITLATPGATIDGITMAAGDRVLVKDQTTNTENGIYIWNGAAVALTRASDMSSNWDDTVPGRTLYVREGTINGTFTWRSTSALNGTFGTTAITWSGDLAGFGKLVWGNSANPTRAAAGPFGQRGFTFIDTTSYGRVWRWQNVSVGNSSGMEFITGDTEDPTSVNNYWWDVSQHTADQEGMRFARRTGSGNPTPKLFVSTTGQLTVGDSVLTGTTTGLSLATSNGLGMYINSVSGVRLPVGTTAERPATPIQGTQRFNSTLGVMEFYTGSAWVRTGQLIQTATGTFATTSSNVQIPFDNTVPLSTEGVQLWSQSFTPVLSNSTIVITVNSFVSVNSAADVIVSGAMFNGTTCIRAAGLHFSTNTGELASYSFTGIQTSGSTAARTYTFRAGPNSNVTVFYGQGTGGQAFGGVSTGIYTIQEFAP